MTKTNVLFLFPWPPFSPSINGLCFPTLFLFLYASHPSKDTPMTTTMMSSIPPSDAPTPITTDTANLPSIGRCTGGKEQLIGI